jgi:hypothetical protein
MRMRLAHRSERSVINLAHGLRVGLAPAVSTERFGTGVPIRTRRAAYSDVQVIAAPLTDRGTGVA